MLMGISIQPSFLNSLLVIHPRQFSKCLLQAFWWIDSTGGEQRGNGHATNTNFLKAHSVCALWNRTKPLRSMLYNPHHPYLRQNLQITRRMPVTQPSILWKYLITCPTLSYSFTHLHLFQETKLTFPNQSQDDELFLPSFKGAQE